MLDRPTLDYPSALLFVRQDDLQPAGVLAARKKRSGPTAKPPQKKSRVRL